MNLLRPGRSGVRGVEGCKTGGVLQEDICPPLRHEAVTRA